MRMVTNTDQMEPFVKMQQASLKHTKNEREK
jgi:hypothetical protein